MLFSRELLQRQPWDAFTGAEDLEYTLNLCLAGVQPAYAASATVRGPMAGAGRSSRTQRLRWEGGRFHQVRKHLGRVLLVGLTTHDPAMLSVAIDLATPPLGLIALVAASGAAVAAGLALAGLVPIWAASTWLLALGLLSAHVLVGLLAGRAPRSAYLALLRAPLFLASKLLVYLRLLAGFDAQRWERTERPGEAAAQPSRVEVAGVAIDPVTRLGAVERIRAALGTRALFQVATVNLDFLVRAQVDPEVREIFRRTGLNVPDGAPVVVFGCASAGDAARLPAAEILR